MVPLYKGSGIQADGYDRGPVIRPQDHDSAGLFRVPPPNRAVTGIARRGGLTAGPKNDYGQVPALEPEINLSIDEQCTQDAECGRLRPFLAARKAVFEVEYALSLQLASARRPMPSGGAPSPSARPCSRGPGPPAGDSRRHPSTCCESAKVHAPVGETNPALLPLLWVRPRGDRRTHGP